MYSCLVFVSQNEANPALFSWGRTVPTREKGPGEVLEVWAEGGFVSLS